MGAHVALPNALHDLVRFWLKTWRIENGRFLSQCFRLGVAEDPFSCRVPVDNAEVTVEENIGQRHALNMELESGKQRVSFGGQTPFLRDVLDDSDQTFDLAFLLYGIAPD